ncbi:MAG: hypothetical protein Q9210_003545 [Variospora velana]
MSSAPTSMRLSSNALSGKSTHDAATDQPNEKLTGTIPEGPEEFRYPRSLTDIMAAALRLKDRLVEWISPKQEEVTLIPLPGLGDGTSRRRRKRTRFLIATDVEEGLNITLDPQDRRGVEDAKECQANVYLPGVQEVRGFTENGFYAYRPGE